MQFDIYMTFDMDNAKIGIGEYLYYCPKKNLLWSKSGLVMEYINLSMFLNILIFIL